MTRVSTSKNDYASQIFQLDLKPKSPRTHEAGIRRVSQRHLLTDQRGHQCLSFLRFHLTEEAPGILINELRMGNHLNKPRRVPILVEGLESMDLPRRSSRSQFSR
jgi:hypothetical protein